MKKIFIVGAGGFGREVACLISDINSSAPAYEIVGFIDDDLSLVGAVINDLPVLGGLSWLNEQLSKRADDFGVVFGIGNPKTKFKILNHISKDIFFPSLVHPTVVMGNRVAISPGVIISAGNILTCNITIESFAMLNLSCTVGHDAKIGAYSVINPAVSISGGVSLGEGSFVGVGATILEGMSVGEWSIIGAGALVNKPLPSNVTAVGVPAKVIKEHAPGWQKV